MKQRKLAKRLLSIAFLSAAPIAAFAQAQGEAQSAAPEVEESEPLVEILVTGSRLFFGDPTVRGQVITAQQIAARGFATAEDIIRSIPQNFASINSATNLRIDRVLDANTTLGAYGLGTSAANLRGLGSANTLVLLNGRRMAGAAGAQAFFANLRDFPAAAIERVEVMMDGGSALYGSDAIAGVINIITKQDYTGLRVAASYQNSSTDAHQRRVNGFGGYNWDGGNATLAFSYTESDPVSNRKAGFVTRDYRSRYNNDSRYDFRSSARLRSGAVGSNPYRQDLILPRGRDGANAQPEDFAPATRDDRVDYIEEDATGATEDRSLTLNLNQRLFDQLFLQGELHWTKADTNRQVSAVTGGAIRVPASNAFNNFGRDVWVRYTPWLETASGLIPPIEQTDRSDSLRYALEANYRFDEHLELRLGYARSKADSEGVQWNFGSNQFTRSIKDPAQLARIDEVLSSSDPNVAVNLFGDGSAQNPGVAELLIPVGRSVDATVNQTFDALLRGQLLQLPGGRMGFTVGGELREEWLEKPESESGLALALGVAKPNRKLKAAFAELSFPLFGADNARPGLESLVLNFKARYDQYSVKGAYGTTVPNDSSAPPNIVKAKFDNLSPRYGMAWKPTPEILVRGSYGESFRAPLFSQLFGTYLRDREFFNFVYDPLASPFPFVPAILTIGSNPDLKSETSDNLDLSLVFTPAWGDGLRLEAAYSRIDYQNRIASSPELGQLLPAEEYGNMPEFFVRDENGVLIESINKSINISKRVSQAIDFSISKALATDWGVFYGEIYYHRVLRQYDQAIPGSPKASFVGESIGIPRSKTKLHLSWKYGKLEVEMWVDRAPGYTNNEFENTFSPLPNEEVDSYTRVDLSAQYQFDMGLRVRAGGRNIFHDSFPWMLRRGQPFDARRVDTRGRVLFLELSYDFNFRQ